MNKVIRKSVAMVLTGSAFGIFSGQALALTALPDLGAATLDAPTLSVAGDAAKRSWSDYGASKNYGWTHTANFYKFAVGSNADVAAGTRFDVTVKMEGNGVKPMLFPGFSIWTSGANPLSQPFSHGGGYGHEWSQVRGPYDGGYAGAPCRVDCTLGSNGWMAADFRATNVKAGLANSAGNILQGRDGWIGYANSGYSFESGDGDLVQGRLAGKTNPTNEGRYWNQTGATPNDGEYSPLTNVNASSPWVNEGSVSLAVADATMNLTGLRAGYYMIGLGGSCPDNKLNNQDCASSNANLTGTGFKLTIDNQGLSAVPVPGAVWLFASGVSLLGLLGKRRQQQG